ncbi:MAG: hypothetical protein AB1650_05255 [Candidatus Omnitrophota bacterium]
MNRFLILIILFVLISAPSMAKGHISDGLLKVYASGEDGPFLMLIEMRRQSLRDGLSAQFYNTGLIEKMGWYKQEVLEGVYQSFWPDGKQKSVLDYKNGLLNGRVNLYDESGRPEIMLTYEKGVLHGQGEYYENGVLTRTVIYDHGWAMVMDYPEM